VSKGCLFGLETECAFTAAGPDGKPVDRARALRDMLALARRRFPCLRDSTGNGIFLPCGRLYVDYGLHPEFSTAECDNPWAVVRCALAGDRLLAELASELERSGRYSRIQLFRCNIDYSGTNATWGCHESYLHQADPMALYPDLVPHLASRVIFTGAGGFDTAGGHPQFMLSPRVAHLTSEISASSTSNRGIVHTKDEPLCAGGYHRLHLLCGESLCSQLACWLKVGTTALVVAMSEAGLAPGEAVRLRSALEAMNAFARDAACRVHAEGTDGHPHTALAIQWHYLELARANARREFMPPWTVEVCRVWEKILESLARDPASVQTTLDWAIKRAIFEECPQVASGKNAARLLEIDTRFGEISERGIFNTLDKDGALSHRIDGIDDIDVAVIHPPPGGRAGVRGRCIREFWRQPGFFCNWGAVTDAGGGRFLDLSDPFTTSELWQPKISLPEDEAAAQSAIRSLDAATRHSSNLDRDGAAQDIAIGDLVAVCEVPFGFDLRWLECEGRIQRVVADGHERFYALDLDHGRCRWPRRCLRKTDRRSRRVATGNG
jgi:hypothetical protein